MHYYKRNIGDYHKKAGRLSILQHGTYTLLIDSCYDRERFPTRDEAIDWTWASTEDEISAVDLILRKFFTAEEQDGKTIYIQQRIQDELDSYHAKSAQNKRIAEEREAKKKKRGRSVNGTLEKTNESPPNQEPRTKNQEPYKDSSTPAKPKHEPQDFIFAENALTEIRKLKPDFKKPNLEAWAKDVRLMREIDKRNLEEMARVFCWAQADQFWQNNILSIGKFRQKYDQLKGSMNTAIQSGKPNRKKVSEALQDIGNTDWW